MRFLPTPGLELDSLTDHPEGRSFIAEATAALELPPPDMLRCTGFLSGPFSVGE